MEKIIAQERVQEHGIAGFTISLWEKMQTFASGHFFISYIFLQKRKHLFLVSEVDTIFLIKKGQKKTSISSASFLYFTSTQSNHFVKQLIKQKHRFPFHLSIVRAILLTLIIPPCPSFQVIHFPLCFPSKRCRDSPRSRARACLSSYSQDVQI